MNTDYGIKDVLSSTSGYVREVSPAAASSERKKGEGPRASDDKQATGGRISEKEVERAASEVQIHLKRLNTELKLDIEVRDEKVVVKILDGETGDLIRQVPSEELMAIRERMEELIGILYDART